MRVTLEWDRNADPHTLGYMVSAGLSSGNYIAQFNVGTQNRLQLDLPHGGAYYAVVRAYDGLGRFGPASPEMVIDLTAPPREPTALRASTSAEHTTLEWNPPSVAEARWRIWYRSAPRRARSTSSTAIRWGWFTPQAVCCRRAWTSPASRR